MTAHPEPRQLMPVEAYTSADWFAREQEALERLDDLSPDADDLPDYVVSAEGPYVYERLAEEEVHPLESDNVTMEDIYACEAVQKGMNSPSSRSGRCRNTNRR